MTTRKLASFLAVIVQELSADDWTVWRSVRLAALADAPDAFGSTLADWSEADEGRWRARLDDVPFNVVAIVDQRAVGQASGTHRDESHAIELISMWVAPTHRGAAVADALLGAVIDHARLVGARAVKLSVRAVNERAKRLYARWGFEETDEPSDEPSFEVMRLGLGG